MKNFKVYKCPICGNIVTKLHDGEGELVCCGSPMKLLAAGENDGAAREKHIPSINADGNKVYVEVGTILHPMKEEHYIEFIVLVTKSEFKIKFLNPGDEPKAEFILDNDSEEYEVYEYCNIHGLFKV